MTNCMIIHISFGVRDYILQSFVALVLDSELWIHIYAFVVCRDKQNNITHVDTK